MELTPSEKTDVKMAVLVHGTQVGMKRCLAFWREHHPSTATFSALLEILRRLRKEDIVAKVRTYLDSR